MRLDDVDRVALRATVEALAPAGPFRTRDVSEHPLMRAAHAPLLGEPQYHALVGKALRRHASALGLRCLGASRGPRGMGWEVLDAPRAETPAPAPPAAPATAPAAPSAHYRSALPSLHAEIRRLAAELAALDPDATGIVVLPDDEALAGEEIERYARRVADARLGRATEPTATSAEETWRQLASTHQQRRAEMAQLRAARRALDRDDVEGWAQLALLVALGGGLALVAHAASAGGGAARWAALLYVGAAGVTALALRLPVARRRARDAAVAKLEADLATARATLHAARPGGLGLSCAACRTGRLVLYGDLHGRPSCAGCGGALREPGDVWRAGLAEELQGLVGGAAVPVLVHFRPPPRGVDPVLALVAARRAGALLVATANAADGDVAGAFGVERGHAWVVYVRGAEVARTQARLGADALTAWVDGALARAA